MNCTKKINWKPLLFMLLLLAAAPLFAQSNLGISELDTLADKIKNVFTSGFVKVILIIFLCASAVTYAFNKDNEKMKRNCIAIIVGAAIIIGAQAIVETVFK